MALVSLVKDSFQGRVNAAQHITNGLLLPVFHAEWGIPVNAHFMVYPERNAQREEVAQFIACVRDQAENSL